MKDNIDIFIELYNEFDDLLRDKFNNFSRSSSMISRYINQLENSNNRYNHIKAKRIDMIRILRNDLVHEFDMNSSDLLKISDTTINFLKEEIEQLKNPICAHHIMTKINNLYYASYQSKLTSVLENMIRKGFTQIPVLENGYLKGVFSPNVLFMYMAKNNIYSFDELKINDFSNYIDINNHVSEKYELINKDTTVDEIYNIFDDYSSKGKKLVAIFVNEHGQINEKILGMIVLNDLLKISNK